MENKISLDGDKKTRMTSKKKIFAYWVNILFTTIIYGSGKGARE